MIKIEKEKSKYCQECFTAAPSCPKTFVHTHSNSSKIHIKIKSLIIVKPRPIPKILFPFKCYNIRG